MAWVRRTDRQTHGRIAASLIVPTHTFGVGVVKVNRWINIALYYKPFFSKALRYYGLCVTRESHSFTCHPHTNHTCLYSPAARYFTALWLVLIAPTREGMARLSWPGWHRCLYSVWRLYRSMSVPLYFASDACHVVELKVQVWLGHTGAPHFT